MYRSRLQGAGFAVEAAGDGLMALDLLPRVRPDAVVLDLMLPKLHGLEVLKFIRADSNLKATPVVILSNVYMAGLATKAIEAGANTGILKTQCTPTKLIRILRDLLDTPPEAGKAQAKKNDRKAPPQDAGESVVEEACRSSARSQLFKEAPHEIARIRQDCLTFVKQGGGPESLETLNSLFRGVRFLTARAGLSGCTGVSDLASALEALLFEIVFQVSRATRSTLQTTVQAVDCLARLIQSGDMDAEEPNGKRRVLVVDDDEVCNLTIVSAGKDMMLARRFENVGEFSINA